MKLHKVKIWVLFAVFTLMYASCKVEEGTEGTPQSNYHKKVLEFVSIEGRAGAANISWYNPSKREMEVTIKYTDNNTEATLHKTSSEKNDELLIEGLENHEYVFEIIVNDTKSGLITEKKQFSVLPLKVYSIEDVIETVVAESNSDGIKFSWQNQTGSGIDLKITYLVYGQEKVLSKSSDMLNDNISISRAPSGPMDFLVEVSKDGQKIQRTISLVVEDMVISNKSEWTVTTNSYRPESPPSNLVDGNISTIWHTPTTAAAGAPGFPYWFIIDMKKEVNITKVHLFKRVGTHNGFGDFEVWGSTNGTDFTQLSGDTFHLIQTAEYDNVGQKFNISGKPRVKYLKIVALKLTPTWTPQTAAYTSLAEVNVYGDEDF